MVTSLSLSLPLSVYWISSERLGLRLPSRTAACDLATPKSLGLQFMGIDGREQIPLLVNGSSEATDEREGLLPLRAKAFPADRPRLGIGQVAAGAVHCMVHIPWIRLSVDSATSPDQHRIPSELRS